MNDLDNPFFLLYFTEVFFNLLLQRFMIPVFHASIRPHRFHYTKVLTTSELTFLSDLFLVQLEYLNLVSHVFQPCLFPQSDTAILISQYIELKVLFTLDVNKLLFLQNQNIVLLFAL